MGCRTGVAADLLKKINMGFFYQSVPMFIVKLVNIGSDR
jgi:hypothetical protein